MKYIKQMKWLPILFLTTNGLVHAQAKDSNSIIRIEHNAKKICCIVYSRLGGDEGYFVHLPKENFQGYAHNSTIKCAANDLIRSIYQFGKYPKDPDRATGRSMVHAVRCIYHYVVCGYADANVNPADYDLNNCKIPPAP